MNNLLPRIDDSTLESISRFQCPRYLYLSNHDFVDYVDDLDKTSRYTIDGVEIAGYLTRYGHEMLVILDPYLDDKESPSVQSKYYKPFK